MIAFMQADQVEAIDGEQRIARCLLRVMQLGQWQAQVEHAIAKRMLYRAQTAMHHLAAQQLCLRW